MSTLTNVLSDRIGPAGSNTQFQYNNSNTMGGTVGCIYLSSGNNVTCTAQHITDIPLTVVGAASATANLLQVANSGSIVFAINSSGVAVGNGAGITSVPYTSIDDLSSLIHAAFGGL